MAISLIFFKAKKEKNPAGTYSELYVVAKNVATKEQFNVDNKDFYTYEVIGGCHTTLATKNLSTKHLDNVHFKGRMCSI